MKKITLLIILAIIFTSCTESDEVSIVESSMTKNSFQPNSTFFKGYQHAVVKDPFFNEILGREFTIETVFMIEEYSDEKRIVLHYFNESLEKGFVTFLSGDTFVFRFNSNDYHTDYIIEKETCYHVSITKKPESNIIRIFINGELVNEISNEEEVIMQGTSFYIAGTKWINNNETPSIIIDEVRMWKYYRNEDEIASNLFTNLINIPDYLLGYYNFNNEPTTEVIDYSYYGIDGHLAGGANENNYIDEFCVEYREE